MNGKQIFGLIATLAVVIGIYVCFYFSMEHGAFLSAVSPEDRAIRGQFGDQFGALNTLYAGIGAALLLFTLFYQLSTINTQQKDIEEQLKLARAQMDELKLQRDALTRSARAHELQFAADIAQMRIASMTALIELAKHRSHLSQVRLRPLQSTNQSNRGRSQADGSDY